MVRADVNGEDKKTKRVKKKTEGVAARRPAESSETRAAIAQRLSEARKGAGLRQVDVSGHLGRPKSWIAKLETGRRSLLFSEALELAELYGTSLQQLSTGQDRARPSRPSEIARNGPARERPHR